MSNRTSRPFRYLAGHDFRRAWMVSGIASRRPGGRPGITCYNCGVYTVNAEWEKLMLEQHRGDILQQCPTFHMDLFGGAPSNLTRRMRDKWVERRK